MGLIRSSRNTIGKESQLPARATGHFDFMDLHRVSETCADQHFAAARVPGKNGGAAKLGVTIRPFCSCNWDWGNPLHDQVIARCENRRRGGVFRASPRREQDDEANIKSIEKGKRKHVY